MPKKIIIIGAGIAGLSAGCYLQMNGYDTEIFEMHNKPGGLCTSWRRKDYLIDGCIHWFVGANPKESYYSVWNELIDMKNFPINLYGEFASVKVDSKVMRFYGDADLLKKELMSISAADKIEITKLCKAIKKIF